MNADLIANCWKKIGVLGDGSCSLLEGVIHCRNCSIYASAGSALLQREPPDGYVEEWTSFLARPFPRSTASETADGSRGTTTPSLSVIIFRLEEEWFALPVRTVEEVTSLCPIHSLPHRSNDILLGIVNIRGEILICISLGHILGLNSSPRKNPRRAGKERGDPFLYGRLVVIEIQGNRWAFAVDEIDSVRRIREDELVDAPSTVTQTPDSYTKKIIDRLEKKINFLDQELLFYELLFSTFSRP